jgi:putative membrane protein
MRLPSSARRSANGNLGEARDIKHLCRMFLYRRGRTGVSTMIGKIGVICAAMLLSTSVAALGQEPAITDAQIAHIAYTAGQIDVDAGHQALERSGNADVRAFAETMVRDHSAVNDQALALVQRLHVTPETNPTSAALTTQAADAHERLSALKGAAFDRAYVENEVAYHQAVNDALRQTLIPNAHNGELKSLLESGLALFSAHQEHAEMLARQLP